MTIDRSPRAFASLAGDLDGDEDDRAPLVLLHGLSFDRTIWGPALTELHRLDPRRRLLTLDLPGHGASLDSFHRREDGAPDLGLETAVSQLRAAIDEAGLGAPVVVGHSAGAIAATLYAANLPTRGVINVDQPLQVEPFAAYLQSLAARLHGGDFPRVWAELLAGMRPDLLPAHGEALVRVTSRPRQEIALGYWAPLLDGDVTVMTEQLAAALGVLRGKRVPYAIVTGAESEPAYREWVASHLPQATFTAWPGSGHFPHVAHPKRFARLLASTGSWPDSSTVVDSSVRRDEAQSVSLGTATAGTH
jgi:pimeloyl-ACP methyl ester carboxylesterase